MRHREIERFAVARPVLFAPGMMKHLAIVVALAAPARADDFRTTETRVAFPGHLFVGHDRAVTEWDAATGALVRTIDWPSRAIELIAASPDGRFVAASDHQGNLVVWDTAQAKVAWTVDSPQAGNTPAGLDIAADGRLAITVNLGVAIYDVATGRGVKTIKLDSQAAALRFAPDGRLAVAAPGLYLFDAAGAPLPEFASDTRESPGRAGAHAIGWSPDGQRVVAVGGHVVLVDPRRPHVLGDLDHGLGSYGHHVVVTGDGAWAGVSSDGDRGGLAWFALPSLTLKATWKLAPVSAMAISRDGKRIAVVQPDQVIKILDAGANTLAVVQTIKLAAPGTTPPPTSASSPSSSAPPPARLPPGADKLLHDAGYAAVVILRENDRIEDRDRRDHAKACEAAVAAALAKLPDTAEVEVDPTQPPLPGSRPYPQGGDVKVPLATVRDHVCHRGVATGQVVDVGLKASAAAMWIGKLEHADTQKESSTSMIELAVTTGAECSKAVADAKKAGLAATTSVELSTYTSSIKSPLPLGELDDKVCKVAQAFGGKVLGERAAAEKATYAPYLKALSGDKAKLMWDKHMLGGENWYGHGGRRLKTPADFAGSDVWYYYVVDRNGVTPRWEVEGYIFSGTTKTGVYDVSGAGDTPPSSAFK